MKIALLIVIAVVLTGCRCPQYEDDSHTMDYLFAVWHEGVLHPPDADINKTANGLAAHGRGHSRIPAADNSLCPESR